MLLNQPPLFDFIGRAAGCPKPIRSIKALIYRQTSDKKHTVEWHADPPTLDGDGWADCTLSVNLGGPYRGGELEIRAPDSKKIMARIANKKQGDAVLFRHSLVHRGAPVLGKRPKLMMFIWFSFKRLHEF
ncbi:MAG: 2OG-Fe(II) oxygenase [Elusimicrobiota bacterium]